MHIKRTAFVLLFLLIFNCKLNSSDKTLPAQTVTINILSKQLRLLKEGEFDDLLLYLPVKSAVLDLNSHEYFNVRRIKIYLQDGLWLINIGTRSFSAPFRFRIFSHKKNSTVRVKLPDGIRVYPLPLKIKSIKSGLKIYVMDSLNRYAYDSSIAEYGQRPLEEKEAVSALEHVIRARYFFNKKRPAHKDSDFCDLTHCQVYRGRAKSFVPLNDEFIIDWKTLSHNLFFHSQCGGKTFDLRVFRNGKPVVNGVRDYLYRDGIVLCMDSKTYWKRSIKEEELLKIIFKKEAPKRIIKLYYNQNKMKIVLVSGSRKKLFSPENFRLSVNRIKGWSFLRSNNYMIEIKKLNGKNVFVFKGRGLGHGVGFCQHGALELARKGYNRYEILRHYYPSISLISKNKLPESSPYLSYCTFDIAAGRIITNNNISFLNRRIPPGSIFKLIVSLYLAKERPDIFNDYRFICKGREKDDALKPYRCWKPEGHGTLNLEEAVPHSCNLYFASLNKKIDVKSFNKFFIKFSRMLEIKTELPETKDLNGWARVFSGLDFRISFSISDLIKILQVLYPDNTGDERVESFKKLIPVSDRNRIFNTLKNTFVIGTGSGEVKPAGALYNYEPLIRKDNLIKMKDINLMEYWGKTSTVIDGTNRALNYGMFIGGRGDKGIIVVIQRGYGHIAAKWALKLLQMD